MKKFNGFENWVITEALKVFAREAEKQVAEAERTGKRLLYAPGFFQDTADSVKITVDQLTKKEHLKKIRKDANI